MLIHGRTLHIDGPIVPSLITLFISSMGTDASGSPGIYANISFGSIGGGDDASTSSSKRDMPLLEEVEHIYVAVIALEIYYYFLHTVS